MSTMLPDPLCPHGVEGWTLCDQCLDDLANSPQEDTPMPPIQRFRPMTEADEEAENEGNPW